MHNVLGFDFDTEKPKESPLDPNMATASVVLNSYSLNPLKADDTDLKNLLTSFTVLEQNGKTSQTRNTVDERKAYIRSVIKVR